VRHTFTSIVAPRLVATVVGLFAMGWSVASIHAQSSAAAAPSDVGAREVTLQRQLARAPLDGKLWLELAKVEFTLRGATSKARELLNASYLVAPGEEALLLERVQFAGGLYAGGMTGVEHDLRADIRKLVRNSPAGRVVELIRSALPKVRPLYLEWVKLLPETERLQIEHAVSRS
jgi:hypothetical protein